MTGRHTSLLDPAATTLLVVDVQERFRAAMEGFDAMAAGCVRLIRTFRLLDLPILITEQYPKGLGRTVPEVLDALGEDDVPEKTAFSSFGCEGIPARLEASAAKTVLVCGIETHVCVHQSVHDLLAAGYRVHVAVDAVESRAADNRAIGIDRMREAGAVLTSTEMAAFELMVDAKHPKFRDVQALYK